MVIYSEFSHLKMVMFHSYVGLQVDITLGNYSCRRSPRITQVAGTE